MVETNYSINEIWAFLHEVPDPEIPVISVVDLGIVRSVEYVNNTLEVVLTPTYSGCPATAVIEGDVSQKLQEKGIANFSVVTKLNPAWTTDWLTEEAKQKLIDYGIAPPVEPTEDKSTLFQDKVEVACPRCKSFNTKLVSNFGSTPCKAFYQCNDCLEPFDYFKCLK